jgi:hypothetical protein
MEAVITGARGGAIVIRADNGAIGISRHCSVCGLAKISSVCSKWIGLGANIVWAVTAEAENRATTGAGGCATVKMKFEYF